MEHAFRQDNSNDIVAYPSGRIISHAKWDVAGQNFRRFCELALIH